MNERDRTIAEAAFRLFAHYGVKKTTLSEIAAEAKVSRQTLYNAFNNKEELMCGAMYHYAQKAADAIVEDCSGADDILERLDIAYKHVALNPFEGMSRIPHAEEIMDYIVKITGPERDGFTRIYARGIEVAIAPAKEAVETAGLSLEDLSVFIKAGFTQLKREAHDVDHMHGLYAVMKQVLKPVLGVT